MEEPTTKKSKSKLTLILRLLVAAAACGILIYNINFRELGIAFSRLQVWVVAVAVIVKLFAEAVMATRWWILLRALKVDISLITAVRLHFHGLFFSSFLPSSMGGDFIRAWYVTHHTHTKRFQSALSVFVDRTIGLTSTLMISVVTYFLFLRGTGILEGQSDRGLLEKLAVYQVWIWILLGSAGLILGGVLLYRPARRWLWDWIARIIHHGIGAFKQLLELLIIFVKKPWLAPLGISMTVFFQCLTFVCFWLIGKDLEVSGRISYYFAFFPLIWVIGSIPISPAGAGVLEGGVVFLFVQIAGSDIEAATALALCQRALFLIGALPGIWIHLRADYLPKSKSEFFIDEKQDIG